MKYYIRTINMRSSVTSLPPITYAVGTHTDGRLLVTMIPNKARAEQYVKDLESSILTELELAKFVHQQHVVNGVHDYGQVASGGRLLLKAEAKVQTKAKRVPPRPMVAAATVAKDPKTRAFLDVAKGAGLDQEDLLYVDPEVAEAIKNVVEVLDKHEMIDGVDYASKPAGDVNYGIPVSAGDCSSEDHDLRELDTWDVMAGRRRLNDGGSSTKREYVPDSIDRVEDF